MNSSHYHNGGRSCSVRRRDTVEDQPIRLAGSVLNEKRHICAFFRTPEEKYQVLLPFIKEGFDRGEKAFHVVDPNSREDHLQRLRAVGIDTDTTEQSGQFKLFDWNEAYFPDGRFDQDSMLAMWQILLDAAEQRGLPRTRLVAQMEWALEDREGVCDLLEYEARFNLVHADHKDPVICAYDVTKFPADVIMDTLRTHPMAIVGGRLQENPFYTPPEQFLHELSERCAT
jgi:MEDS: MEthanogen/methylotroph, DcmR Sensory domain